MLDKKILIIFPVVVTLLSILIFISLGAHERNHIEAPMLFSIVILMFIKVSRYNRKLKKHRFYEQSGKIPTTFDKEVEEYKRFQKTLNILIVEMFVVYFITLLVVPIVI